MTQTQPAHVNPESISDTSRLITMRNEAAAAYYGSGDTIMSDDQFDALTTELSKRGAEEQVGHGSAGGKYTHQRRMLSLEKVHDVAALETLVRSDAVIHSYTIEPKFDGLSASVRYNKAGRLSLALTRGDGEKGDDITRAIKAIFDVQGLPLQLTAVDEATGNSAGEVRGEIVMLRSAFTRLNEERTAADEKPLVNPRNAAAGLIARVARNVEALRSEEKGTTSHTRRQQAVEDAVAAAGRWLTFIPFDGDGAVRLTARSSEFLFPGARGLGDRRIGLRETDPLAPFPHYLLPASPFRAVGQEIIHPVSWLNDYADSLDVDTDGVVVKLTEPEMREMLGESSTAPRWALAYKYPNRSKQTVLRAVEWSETRTGRVVPTAVFDPVELSGAMVSRATLNNFAFLEELDVWIGDTIEVTRANEVIPNVVGRVGEHAADATPALDPNGWPVGAGELVKVHLDESKHLTVDLHIPDSGERSSDSFGLYIGDATWGHNVMAYFDEGFHPEPHDPNGYLEVELMHVYSNDAMRDAAEASARSIIASDIDGLSYRREGRDFVHDGGRDPVKDITFAASKLDILGLGEDVVRRLLADNAHVDSFPALLEACRKGTLAPFERGTQKLVDKLAAEVLGKTSGPQDPAKWIAAVGLAGVGVRAGKKLAAAIALRGAKYPVETPFDDLSDMVDDPGSLEGIDGFGPSMVQSIVSAKDQWDYWHGMVFTNVMFDWTKYAPKVSIADEAWTLETPENGGPIEALISEPHHDTPFAGKRVLVTGSLPTLSRKQAEARIEELGGAVASSVSKNLDLLVAGEKAGSKLAKAEALGIEVMTGYMLEEIIR